MRTVERIIAALDHPATLEGLYQQDPESFRDAFAEAARTAPDSAVLQVWAARLEYRAPARGFTGPRFWSAIGLALLVGVLLRIPAVWLREDWFYSRFAPSLVILSLAAYFWLVDRSRARLVAGLALLSVVVTWAAVLPGEADSVVMALLHLPVLCWAFLGLVHSGGSWREPEPRIRFLRYNGELLILGSLVVLGGMVFSGITVALFSLMFKNPEEWYARNIGVFGAAGVPLVATYLYDVVFRRRTGIAPVLARVFAPLFLVMTVVFLAAALAAGQNPFLNRDFLIIVNGLLLVVLGMTVFSLAERGEQTTVGWLDYINVGLLVVTLVVDLIALSAIVFRLTSWGLTPNRVVVLGANLVIMTHLAVMCRASVGLLRGTAAPSAVRKAVTSHLPVYVAWAALVAFMLPVLFGFE